MTTDTQPHRIPIARSVVYAVRGVPEVPAEYTKGLTLAPTEITLTYRSASDSQLGRVHAYVKGWWMRADGERYPTEKPVGQHYYGGPEGWPAWLAEEARLHDPDASVPPAPVDRAAVLRDFLWRLEQSAGDAAAEKFLDDNPELRRMAAEDEQPETQAADEDPARIDRLRPEFTEHSSVEAIDAQLRRSRAQQRRWHLRTEWLISLREARVKQKELGEWPAVTSQPEPVVEPHCDGFPTTCPNRIPAPPNPPHHDGGIRCGCYDEPAATQPGKEA